MWDFHIDGYRVWYAWLYDPSARVDQASRTPTAEDIAHYQRIVVATKETIRLMGEIDVVIDAHGGWPSRSLDLASLAHPP